VDCAVGFGWKLALTAVALFLSAVTVIVPEWIEVLTGLDPDSGSGALEWLVVASLLAMAVVSAVLAHAEWRHAAAAQPS
jgi:hypothetical protein